MKDYIKARYTQRQRQYAIKTLLTDVCQIEMKTPLETTPNEFGIVNPSPNKSFRYYVDSYDIPCRVDTQRAFFNDKYKDQSAVTNPYVLELPYDLPLAEQDKVYIKGNKYEIRRIYEVQELATVKEALITEVTGIHD